jgi:hypothetical protein
MKVKAAGLVHCGDSGVPVADISPVWCGISTPSSNALRQADHGA